MKFDSYPRFLKSDLYKNYLMREISGENVTLSSDAIDKDLLVTCSSAQKMDSKVSFYILLLNSVLLFIRNLPEYFDYWYFREERLEFFFIICGLPLWRQYCQFISKNLLGFYRKVFLRYYFTSKNQLFYSFVLIFTKIVQFIYHLR